MSNGMSVMGMGIGIDWQQVTKGVVLMVAVFLDVYYKKKGQAIYFTSPQRGEAVGFLVLRFWNADVFTNLEGVLETIRATLKPEEYSAV
jgi:Protein of unknown function (DUF559)